MSELWYISFATSEGPLGATVVAGENEKDALRNATERGLNPGGEAAILWVPPDVHENEDMKAYQNRLVSPAELFERGGAKVKDLPEYMQDRWNEETEVVCEDCNKGTTHEH